MYVFDVNTADPSTVGHQVKRLKDRLAISRVALVGYRSMITSARIAENLKPAGLDWITCMRALAIQAPAAAGGPLQMSLSDERGLAEISAPEQFPGWRLIVCRNHRVAAERTRKREDLLAAIERELVQVQSQLRRRHAPLKTAGEIGMAVGAALDSHKMAKHFAIEIRDGQFAFQRHTQTEARLDGIYLIRTSMPPVHLDATEAVQASKDSAQAERAFRCLKTVDLDIRPIHHRTAARVRAHVFLCMLAYHVEWHLRDELASWLSHDTDLVTTRAGRSSSADSTRPADSVKARNVTKPSADGNEVVGSRGLMAHLGTLTRTACELRAMANIGSLCAKPTQLREAAFKLVGFDPIRNTLTKNDQPMIWIISSVSYAIQK